MLFRNKKPNQYFQVISILPSILSAAAQNANMTEIQETMSTKGNEGRMMQMLIYAGLRYLTAQ